MKALTICQPYAHLIVSGEKRVENRVWPTNYRGKLIIHAGKSKEWINPGDEDVNRRAKLTRILGKSALKSFHPGLLNVRHLVGEIWSDNNGYNCRNKKASFC